MAQENWLRGILGKIKQSQTLAEFFRRRRIKAEGSHAFWSDDLEQLIMEMLLLRYQARNAKEFARADSYRFILEHLGLDMVGLDRELNPSRTTPEWLAKVKG